MNQSLTSDRMTAESKKPLSIYPSQNRTTSTPVNHFSSSISSSLHWTTRLNDFYWIGFSLNLSIFTQTNIYALSDKMIADQLVQSYINFMFHLLYLGSQSTAKVTFTKLTTLNLSLTFLFSFFRYVQRISCSISN